MRIEKNYLMLSEYIYMTCSAFCCIARTKFARKRKKKQTKDSAGNLNCAEKKKENMAVAGLKLVKCRFSL